MYYFMMGLGCLFVAIGLGVLLQRVRLLRHSIMGQGRVVDWKESSSISNHRKVTSYAPVVEFTATDGSSHRIEGGSGTSAKPALGRVYPVRYDPRDPKSACIATVMNFWILPFVILAAGAFLLWLGSAVVRIHG